MFFYKSNWQNELLRLQRRNKFICALMVSMQEVGIEGPHMRLPGQKEDIPFYYQHAGGCSERQASRPCDDFPRSQYTFSKCQPTSRPTDSGDTDIHRSASVLRHPESTPHTRNRGESITAMSKRVDFSLGMKDISSGDMMGELYESVSPTRISDFNRGTSSRARNAGRHVEEENDYRESTLDHTTSRTSESRSRFSLNRTSTESQKRTKGSHPTSHRNRFFSRRTKKESRDDEYDDLMELGMADIPDSSAPFRRIDRRSGAVSSRALRRNTDSKCTEMEYSDTNSNSAELADDTNQEERIGSIQTGTEAFEMNDVDRKI